MKPIAIGLAALFASAAFAGPPSLEESLASFEANPRRFMETIPVKDEPATFRNFTREQILGRAFVPVKNAERRRVGRAKIKGHDRPEDVIDNPGSMLTTIQELSEKRLLKKEVKNRPWSDYYWAFFQGQLAYRYADKNFPKTDDWQKAFRYLEANPIDSSSLETLSPAEKYDLLVGDENRTLTKLALEEGEAYYRESGKVEDWMGICDGWAPASFALPRPSRAIKVLAADGKTKLTFYPSDIKALASLLWAINPGEVRFIGGRCDVMKAKTDEFGRVKNDDCFDTNPATWHLAIVNQIGLAGRPLIMDATLDYEVWNHPVVAYEISFFHPQRMMPVKKLEEAIIPRADFAGDRFAKFRHKDTAAMVGVSMKIRYSVETNPRARETDGPENDRTNGTTYLYDLELDQSGKVIGGEWYMNAHPDFLWTPEPGARALTPGDELLQKEEAGDLAWNGKTAVPARWREVALRTSKGGAPLALIVESLIEISNNAGLLER